MTSTRSRPLVMTTAVAVLLILAGGSTGLPERAVPAAAAEPQTSTPAPAVAAILGAGDDPATLLRAAHEVQAERLGVALREAPPWPGPPSEALALLASLHTQAPRDAWYEDARTLDALPADQAGALAGLVHAHVDLERAAAAAWASGTDGWPSPEKRAPVLGARLALVMAAIRFADVWPGAHGTGAGCEPLRGPMDIYILDLVGCDNVYTNDTFLLIDVGGNDVYRNNAGGNGLGVETGPGPGECANLGAASSARVAAALFDLAGRDVYGDAATPRSCGVIGGGYTGVGFLFDASGDDQYHGGHNGTVGGAAGGLGFLYDGAGNDTYRGGRGGTNGGARLGASLLVDRSGNDTYSAEWGGVNGGGDSGLGMLIDATGSDAYTAGSYGVNGGAISGGRQWHPEGDVVWGDSAGLLIDGGGDDAYLSGGHGANGGALLGVGTLWDAQGDDVYVAAACGVNGGGPEPACAPLPPPAWLGMGLLHDGSGHDGYHDAVIGACWDCSVVPKGTVGVQRDSDG